MIARLVSWISALVAGAAMLWGGASGSTGFGAQMDPAGLSMRTDNPVLESLALAGWFERRSRPFKGDPLVRHGLVLAAVSVTDLSSVEVLEALEAGKNVGEITESAGNTVDEVLEAYDETTEFVFNTAKERRGLPASLVESRIEWYQEAGRQMVDQPGLTPAYPGLHQLHVAIILAAAKVGELGRTEIRDGLKACQSLDDILEANGQSGSEAVDLAAGRIDERLQKLVDEGRLSEGQQQKWLAGITAALEQMVGAPGLHVAGGACAP
jgi:hypothetical protein